MIVLKFDTQIKGTCTEPNHEDSITLESYTFSSSRYVQINDGERETGVANVSELVLTKLADISSPELFLQSCNGKSLGTATLSVLQTGGSTEKPQVYLTVILSDALITGYLVEGLVGRPTERIHVSFTKIKYKYIEFSGDVKKAPVEKTYNIKTRSAE
ncbi:MAG: type VI secretion system tube protein Hcp [Pseudomonas sp.]|uniref:Hcp family type VI secretion system effector n=1 Tax=Pseudomonas sp. TaxID=306 RepID=UPI003982A892